MALSIVPSDSSAIIKFISSVIVTSFAIPSPVFSTFTLKITSSPGIITGVRDILSITRLAFLGLRITGTPGVVTPLYS